MAESLAQMAVTVLSKEERDYIDNMLKACSDDLGVKTYMVLREKSAEEMAAKINEEIAKNPLFELASKPLNLRFLDIDRWVAILVEYENN